MARIKCSVDNCTFWENNLCTADEIEVAKNFMEGDNMEAGIIGKDSDTSTQTKCVTFKPKNK